MSFVASAAPYWTVVADYEGGTYVSQCQADSVEDACALWMSAEHDWLESPPSAAHLDRPEPLEGLSQVWCASLLTEDEEMILLHLIRTDAHVTVGA